MFTLADIGKLGKPETAGNASSHGNITVEKRGGSIRPFVNSTGFPSAWGLPQAHEKFLRKHGDELRLLSHNDTLALGRLLMAAGKKRGAMTDPHLNIADSEKENLTTWSTEKTNMTTLNFSSSGTLPPKIYPTSPMRSRERFRWFSWRAKCTFGDPTVRRVR